MNFKILLNEVNNGAPETGGKMGYGTGVRAHLLTFENYATFLQPRGVHFAGPMLADVC